MEAQKMHNVKMRGRDIKQMLSARPAVAKAEAVCATAINNKPLEGMKIEKEVMVLNKGIGGMEQAISANAKAKVVCVANETDSGMETESKLNKINIVAEPANATAEVVHAEWETGSGMVMGRKDMIKQLSL